MKKTITFILLFFGMLSWSQQQFFPVEQDSVRLESFLKIGTNLVEYTVGVELPIFKEFSVNLEYGFSALGYSMRNQGYERTITMLHFLDSGTPIIKSEFKWNYNFQKRHRKNKDTTGNSSNYLALQFKYSQGKEDVEPFIFPWYRDGLRSDNTFLTDFHWGIQRDLGSRFTIVFFVGWGFLYDLDTDLGGGFLSLNLKFNLHLIKLF